MREKENMCFKRENMIDIRELMCRATYQIQVAPRRDDNLFDPVHFGSAIIFAYKEHFFLISAEHVVSSSNFFSDLDEKINYIGGVPTNKIIQTPEGQLCSELACFTINTDDFTKQFKWNQQKQTWDTERVDIFYYPIEENSQFTDKEFVTQGMEFPDIKIEAGQPKIKLFEKDTVEPDCDHIYAILGYVQNGVAKDGIHMASIGCFHFGMTMQKAENGKYFLDVCKDGTNTDKDKYWSGLSGSAVWDMNVRKIIGIATLYDQDNLTLEVVSMKQVKVILDEYLNSRKFNSNTFITKI